MTDAPKSRSNRPAPNWLRIVVRSLLLLALVVAVACGWLVSAMSAKRPQKEAVASIRKAGGRVTYDYQRDWSDTKSEPPAPTWLWKLLGPDLFANVSEVDAQGKLGDASSKDLKGFTQLQKLGLDDCPITDAGLENLVGLTQLRTLDLRRTRISDAGLKHLEGLSKLQKLYLFGDAVTDAGMDSLAKLSQLDDLELSNTKVSEAALEKLKGSTHFRWMGLGTLGITDAGLRYLEACPNSARSTSNSTPSATPASCISKD